MSTGKKVTLYATVLNEVDSIDKLLDSLLAQTRKPDELIFVDGGSRDGTLERIAGYQITNPLIKLIPYPGSSPAEGRNKGFASSSFDLVASIDGGCHARSDWLENLLKEVRPGVDVVSGVYLPDPKTSFERCVADMMFPDIKSLPEDWSNPSHRSVLIRKHVWEIVGGYPPHLGPSEDTWFNQEAARRGFRFKLARDAVVYWRPRRNLVEIFKNTFRWKMCDAEYRIGLGMWPRRLLANRLVDALSVIGWSAAFATAIVASPLLGGIGLLLLTVLMIRPFRTIRFFGEDKFFGNKVTKNLINLTNSFAWLLGHSLGVLARARRRSSGKTVATGSGT